jgi:hypothetical protein
MVSCVICEKEFGEDKRLHAHLKAHKLRVAEYYQTHYARYDKCDNSIIKFKNKKQYLNSDFNSRITLKKWLKESSEEDAKEYCTQLLIKRKEKKDLIYAPTQVELRSILSPPVHYYNELFGSYYELCESLGYKNRFHNPQKITYGNAYDDPSYKIYVDTREKKPLKFKNFKSETKTLKFGDYALNDKDVTCNCYIERKAIGDFIGTLSGGYDRFTREIERAAEAEAKLIVLVEESFSNCLGFNYLPHVYKKTKVTPDYIFHNVRKLIQTYPHIQFLFVKGRVEASETIEKIFTCGCAYEKIDLQLAYDTKIL